MSRQPLIPPTWMTCAVRTRKSRAVLLTMSQIPRFGGLEIDRIHRKLIRLEGSQARGFDNMPLVEHRSETM